MSSISFKERVFRVLFSRAQLRKEINKNGPKLGSHFGALVSVGHRLKFMLSNNFPSYYACSNFNMFV